MSKKRQPTEKAMQYASQLSNAIMETISDDDSHHYIGIEDLQKGENLKEFIYAICVLVPTQVTNKLSGRDDNHLENNHLANQLIMEYSQVID